jgi:hypothetical protein
MIDEDGQIVENSLGDQGLAVSCRISECYEQLGQLHSALRWSEIALEIENSDGRLQANWLSPNVERVNALRQKLRQ